MSKDEGEWEGLEDDEGVTRKREARRGAPSLVYRVFAAPRVPFPLIAAVAAHLNARIILDHSLFRVAY